MPNVASQIFIHSDFIKVNVLYCWIHLPHLRIRKYFTDNSSINFHYNIFLHFLPKIGKKWRKTLSWKFTDESSIKCLWIHKWCRWIWHLHILIIFFQKLVSAVFSKNVLTSSGPSMYNCWLHHISTYIQKKTRKAREESASKFAK